MDAATSGYQKSDWLAFTATTASALAVYLFTLTPNVGLGFSGIFSTTALHGGVPHPPGYPLAVWWQGLFVILLPFSNIAWRVAVSSAVAGALACGLIALLVSRLGKDFINISFSQRQATALRIISGFAAGNIFAFNGAFWGRAVIADVWTLSLFLFCSALCLLLRWCWTPHRTRYLYLSAFIYGLTLTNSQILLAVAPAIPALIAIGNRELARDLLIAGCVLFVGGLIEGCPGGLNIIAVSEGKLGSLLPLHLLVGLFVLIACVILIAKTRRILTEWKSFLACTAVFVLGLTPYLYVPISSMTNPPMNWAYSRTTGGFFHLVSRGQYERIEPTSNVTTFAKQMTMYAAVTGKEFGWPFLILASVPWLFLRQCQPHQRAIMLALLVLYACLTFLLVAVLNPVNDTDGRRALKVFFSASYVMLAVWLGLGLIKLAQLGQQSDRSPDS
jgi:hypothetical protein